MNLCGKGGIALLLVRECISQYLRQSVQVSALMRSRIEQDGIVVITEMPSHPNDGIGRYIRWRTARGWNPKVPSHFALARQAHHHRRTRLALPPTT